MIILGISDGQHDASACIIKDGKILSAINEERLTRVKLKGGLPKNVINYILEKNNLKPKDIDVIVYGSILTPPIFARIFRSLQNEEERVRTKKRNKFYNFLSDLAQFRFKYTSIKPYSFFGKFNRLFLKKILLKELGRKFKNKKIYFVEHHLSHTASAHYTSGNDINLVVTCDYWGDGISFTISKCIKNNIKRIYSIDASDSLGVFYSAITKYLGFRPFRHEGKIVGLAAYGKSENVKIDFPFIYKNGKLKYIYKQNINLDDKLNKKISKYSREDIAAWLQRGTEDIVVEIVSEYVDSAKLYNIALAGGLFSNVKINQKIKEIKGVRNIWVFPDMGDGGLSVGGALYFYNKHIKYYNKTLENVYLGNGFSNDEIKKELDNFKLKYIYHSKIENKIAELISKGKVVARFNGKMEYGPRALGNRSILYHAKDPEVNNWLNKRLKRTEFMPFAPATLYEHRKKCYNNIDGGEHPAKFMTITFNCTDYMKKNGPAAVHIDGTARPQLVTKEINPSFYKIIREYHRLTGIPSVINTSFNMHEEPIVCSPSDAIRSFLQGNLDYLAIGNYLVKS